MGLGFDSEKSRLLKAIRSRGVVDSRVLDALAKVSREDFVPHALRDASYQDRPLPIPEEQTISQPFVVALMTQALEIQPTDHILEIGTGSGYQTAILAELAGHVFTVEVRPALGVQARELLEQKAYSNIDYLIASGQLGWPEKAPFDAIIVTAAAAAVPENLLQQLKEGGRLVIPLETEDGQELFRFQKKQGTLDVRSLGPVRFVPMV